MKTYPRLMDQMRDIIEEWKEEREQLLINAEQTHAYCQSLAFQVRAGRSSCERGRWRPCVRVRGALDARGTLWSCAGQEHAGGEWAAADGK